MELTICLSRVVDTTVVYYNTVFSVTATHAFCIYINVTNSTQTIPTMLLIFWGERCCTVHFLRY